MSASDAAGPVEDDEVDALFASKKKKKRAAPKKGAEGDDGEVASASFSASSSAAAATAAPASVSPDTSDCAEVVDESYDDMLQKVYAQLLENNPELLGREKKRLKPPQVSRVGTTRTAWTNFKDICAGLKRTPDHILSFYLAELGTTGAIDGSDRLLLKGKYQPKYVESLLRKYIAEFVQCHMCRNTETDLRRDNVSRLFFMDCKACGSSRSVAPIKAGFHATSKGERKKAREAQI